MLFVEPSRHLCAGRSRPLDRGFPPMVGWTNPAPRAAAFDPDQLKRGLLVPAPACRSRRCGRVTHALHVEREISRRAMIPTRARIARDRSAPLISADALEPEAVPPVLDE